MENKSNAVKPNSGKPYSDKSYSDKQTCPVEELHLDRRVFAQIVASGLMITIATPAFGQQRRGRGQGRARPVSARLLLNKDGTITALSGKVEEGQGPRAELSQAVAEELRVAVDQIRLVMADTDLVPDDGVTAGSRTTPRNVPQMRVAAATAREMLTDFAAQKWNLDPSQLELRDGVIAGPDPEQRMSYADLAEMDDVSALLTRDVRAGTEIGPVESWQVLGKSVPRPNGRDLVTGAHRFPSDIQRPGMLHGKVLRPPAYGATLESVDLVATMEGVVVVREDQFVAVAAPTSLAARQALAVIAKSAKWKLSAPAVSNANLYAHLKENATGRERTTTRGEADQAMAGAAQVLEGEFEIAYIQHAPMEPRAAVAEWSGDRLTVWVGCDGPFRARGTVARELGVPEEQVRVIVPDMGGGFGGKHTAEPAVEAARLAKAAGAPVSVRWTRPEEFTWAYCRPAAVIECKGGLNAGGSVVAWQFRTINAGGSSIDTPYAIPNTTITSVGTDSPLPQGSYRGLGSTGNNFARESLMDDLAAAAGKDPLAFRLAQLENPRLRRVLEKAASEFGWDERRKSVTPELGVGLACGTEKNSVVAACVEVALDRQAGTIRVTEVCQAFEAGPVLDPKNLTAQVQGCILMALGGALTEELQFEDGKILNPRFARYRVPRFRDVPKVDVHLVENHDIPAAGGGETPIIAVAPAIGNAVFAATGIRLRSMPMRGEEIRGG